MNIQNILSMRFQSTTNSTEGSNLSMERYFTSASLAAWALEKKVTIIGTIHRDRKGIPKELKKVKSHEKFDGK